MKHAHIFFGLGVLVFSAMPALAKPAYVGSTVNLRAAPGTKSEVVTKIPGGSLIDAGECSEGWCEVTWQDKKGFAIETALDLSGRVPRQAAGVRQPVYGANAPATRTPAMCRWTSPLITRRRRSIIMARPLLLPALLGLAPALVMSAKGWAVYVGSSSMPNSNPSATLSAR